MLASQEALVDGRYAEARPILERLIAIRPGRWEDHVDLGECLSKLGEREQAVKELNRAIALAPLEVEPQYQVGLALLVSGDAEGARAKIEAMAGPSGFMLFATQDHGSLLRLAGQKRRAIQYVVGNPLFALQMTQHDIRASLYAPLRVLIYEDEEGQTCVEYDRPSSESLDLETHSVQLLPVGVDGVELLIGQLHGERQQQPLCRSPGSAQLSHDRLIQDPLMSRVLINDDDAIGALVQDVGIEDLKQRRDEAGRALLFHGAGSSRRLGEELVQLEQLGTRPVSPGPG